MEKNMILAIAIVLVVMIAGCSNKAAEQQAQLAGKEAAKAAEYEPLPVQQPEAQKDPVQELRALEITPSGDEMCFLSPCDCVCYPVKNVPLNKRVSTCAIDCKEFYGVTGCEFTNFQCATLKGGS